MDIPQNATLLERAQALEANGVFLGGPIRKFEPVGRNQLSILLRSGLNFDSKVLDVGCGCLRAGYWLINFLKPDCYFGIEPNTEMLGAGQQHIVTQPVIDAKGAKFDSNAEFNFQVFDATFDFVIARSIWTHASAIQIEKMLDEFVATTTDSGVFVTSFKPTRWYEKQYSGTEWVGKSDTSDEGGIVRYRFSWIKQACASRGLSVERLENEYGQTWVRISK